MVESIDSRSRQAVGVPLSSAALDSASFASRVCARTGTSDHALSACWPTVAHPAPMDLARVLRDVQLGPTRRLAVGFTFVCMAARLLCTAAAADPPAPKRVHELGLIDYYARYYNFDRKGRPVKDRRLAVLADLLRQAGLPVTVIDVDVLLDFRKSERNTYKRLLIPEFAFALTRDMHEGLADYVEHGGLLVVNNSYFQLDEEREYWLDARDKRTRIPERSFLGVFGHRSPVLNRIKLVQACPLTQNLPVGTWIDLRERAWARQTRNLAAEVIGHGNLLLRGKDVTTALLTYKKSGAGAAIYLGPFLRAGALAEPSLRKIVHNVFSDETLRWLCRQPRSSP